MRILTATVGLVLLNLSMVSATPLYVSFCPGDATCPVGVTEASVLIQENDSADPNDYDITLTIAGGAAAPYYVDEVSFIMARYADYQTMTLQNAPISGGAWTAYFDNVSGNAGSCVEDTGQQGAVCAQSGPGDPLNYGVALQNQTLLWTFYVDLKTGVSAVSETDAVNLRAQFLTEKGKNAGILSPEPIAVPEPATGALVTLGCLGLAALRRRRAPSKA